MWGRKAKVGRMSYLLFCLSTTNKRHSLFFSIESLFFYVQAEKNKQTKKKERKKKNHIRCTGKSKLILLFNRFIISYSLCKRKNFRRQKKWELTIDAYFLPISSFEVLFFPNCGLH